MLSFFPHNTQSIPYLRYYPFHIFPKPYGKEYFHLTEKRDDPQAFICCFCLCLTAGTEARFVMVLYASAKVADHFCFLIGHLRQSRNKRVRIAFITTLPLHNLHAFPRISSADLTQIYHSPHHPDNKRQLFAVFPYRLFSQSATSPHL